MSRMMVLAVTVLSLVLVTGLTNAQQTMQPGQQQQPGVQQGSQGMSPSPGAWNSPQTVQRLSQAVSQSNVDLQKAIDLAVSQTKGKAVGAAFVVPPQPAGGATGQSAGDQSQDVHAHVYVVADTQLKDVMVDAKNNKVLNVETRQMVSNPWSYREGREGMESGTQGPGGTLRERAGMPSSISMLRLDTAQRVVRFADQDNITLQKAISTAQSQAQGGRVVGAFLVLRSQANVGAADQPSTAGQQQPNLYAKVFAVVSDQVKVMTIDAKSDKVISTETRSTFISPWESRMRGAGTGSSGGMPQGQTGTQGQPGQTSTGESWPTGSSGGTGPGSLGGQ